MKKIIISLVLLVIIIASFTFSWAKISANGNENNYFNQNLRGSVSASPLLRRALGLHYDGDAKNDYLGSKYDSILINIVSMPDLGLNFNIARIIADKVGDITGKNVKYIFADEKIKYAELSQAEDLSAELIRLRKKAVSGDAVLYIMVVGKNRTDDKQIGSTLQEDGIILFQEALLENSRKEEEIFEKYIVSTLMHEFGHQIGLGHNNDQNCLMNPIQEFYASKRIEDILVDFCRAEKIEIDNLKKSAI